MIKEGKGNESLRAHQYQGIIALTFLRNDRLISLSQKEAPVEGISTYAVSQHKRACSYIFNTYGCRFIKEG
jgi:hypothetical protein